MIEVPRAALTAAAMAGSAEFFSFGTNDLTQMTWGFSRDDVEAAFFGKYLQLGIFGVSPFETIDREGVGQLVEIAVRQGRETRPGLVIGVCGEHGGDPASVWFFQRRAIQSADLALVPCGRSWVPVRRSWRLNSNHYGALQGRSKAEVRAEAGDEQFMLWRRGYHVRPPQGEPDDDLRYAALPLETRPRGESLHDVTRRLLPYWYDAIVPDLRRYGCVLVASHGNTLRALVKHLEAVTDEAASGLEVPNAHPLCYQFQAGQPGHLTRLTD